MSMQSKIKMECWDDWFENCGKLVTPMTKYEDVLWNYYENGYGPHRKQECFRDYAAHHDSKFYEKQSMFPFWKWKSVLLKTTIGFLAGTVVGTVVMMIVKHLKFQLAVGKGCMIGFLAGLLVAGVCCIFEVLKVRKLCRQMTKLDMELRDRLSYIPPKYRNSIALKYLSDLYMSSAGVLRFQQAVQELDDWFAKLPRNNNCYIGRVIAVMFDIPYEPALIDGEDDEVPRDLYIVDGSNPALQNPNLPKDIATKTFQGVDSPDDKLKELIGLDGVKQQVAKMKNRMEFYSSTGAKTEKISGNHMCFLGSPGTGKTTVARILTRILYDFGYIRENKCVEVDGNYFKSSYVGETASRTKAIIDYAMGGVLFIDEAYLLMDAKGTAGSAGTEALGALLKSMEDNQRDFVVIFAGYEDSVNRLLNTNEGFSSRIKHKIYFEDFTLMELMKIFELDMKHYAKNGHYRLANDARPLLERSFDMERTSPTFGNARVVRNALDMLLDIHADHYMNGLLMEADKFVLTKKDVEVYVSDREKQITEDTRNYIASQNLDSQIINFNDLKSRTKDGSVNPDKELQSLTGLAVLKKEIAKMKAQFEFYNGSMGGNEGHHMCFMGSPGTGKSTVAKIITGYLYQMGMIRRNEYLDINGDFLRGMYVGHTGKRTEAVINYCQGMVLFLDEAYLLGQGKDGDNFGQEAIGVLIDAMEKRRQDFVVIVAGYEREMKAFLNMNSGMQSRISHTFHFESYTPYELAQMMQSLARKDKFTIARDVWIPLQQYLQTKVDDPYFGNGRFIRNLWQDVKQAHIMAFSEQQYSEDQRYFITKADCELGIRSCEQKKI